MKINNIKVENNKKINMLIKKVLVLEVIYEIIKRTFL